MWCCPRAGGLPVEEEQSQDREDELGTGSELLPRLRQHLAMRMEGKAHQPWRCLYTAAFNHRWFVGPQPVGASLMMSQPTGWDCIQLAHDRSACRSENPMLENGESVEFAAIVRIPLGAVEPCVISNRAQISSVDGGPALGLEDASTSALKLDSHLSRQWQICLPRAVHW